MDWGSDSYVILCNRMRDLREYSRYVRQKICTFLLVVVAVAVPN